MSVFTNPASGAADRASSYIEAVLALVGDRDPLDILRESVFAVAGRVAGRPPGQLTRPEVPGKWSVAGVVQHLAESDLVWSWRLRLVFAEDRPTLSGYNQDLWSERLHDETANLTEDLELFRVVRRANLKLLGRAGPDDLNRVGIHVERGEESIAHMMRLYAGHDLVHIAQIDRILAVVR